MRLHPTLFIISAFAFASLQLGGQSSNTPDRHTPTFQNTARAVIVDVVVTKNEKPILGLKKQNFEVFENGKPQTIDFFEEHTVKTLPPGAVPPLPKMPPGVYTNVPPAPENDSVNVLLLDVLNTDRQDQVYVHNQILQFLKTMQPGTRAAIFVLSSRLRMVQGFTADSSLLRGALNHPKYGVQAEKPNESRSTQDKIDDVEELKRMVMMSGGRWTEGISAIQSAMRESANVKLDQRIGMTLEALQALARYLAAVPGRKNLIWYSSSFPVSVFPQVGQNQRPNQLNTDSLREFGNAVKETADLLTASKIAVYPVGAEGVMSEHIFGAGVSEPTDYEGMTVKAPGVKGEYMTPYTNENSARADKIMSMEQLARDTGGEAFFNTNDLNAATQKAIANGANYYTLAYTPTNKKMDGKFRRIEVKVTQGKYRLAYRHGYNADKGPITAAKTPETSPLNMLMMPGMPDATQILFAARVLPAIPQPPASSPRAGKNTKLTGPTTRYSIDFMIRWTDVKLDPEADGTHSGKIQVALQAHDREGNALNWINETQVMKLKPDLYAAIQRSGVPAHMEIDLPSDKDVILDAGVYDLETGRAGTLEVSLMARNRASAAGTQPVSHTNGP